MLSIIFYFGLVGLFLTASLLGPIFVGLLASETETALRFASYLVFGSFIFGSPVLAIAGRLKRLPEIGSLMLVFLTWTILPLAAAVPIWNISGLPVIDAVFEAVSGLTTTGASVLSTVEEWPQSLIFWRVQLQWVGAYLALLTVVLIMAPLGLGGLSSAAPSISGGKAAAFGQNRLRDLAINLGVFYAIMTLFCALFLLFAGTRPFYAVTLAMTSVSTGGFLPFDGPIEQATNGFGVLTIGVFLLGGATCIFWQRMLVKGQVDRLAKHRESYFVMLLAGVLTVLLVISILTVSPVSGSEVGYVIVEAFMNAASLVATSGVESRPGIVALLPLVLVLFIIFLGGSAFSTSGGLKHYRFGGMVVQSWGELDRLVYPNAVHPARFGTQGYDQKLIGSVWSFFVAAILTIAAGTIAVAAAGIPFEAALTATISCFATAGPIYNAGWAASGDWPTYSAFPPIAKASLMIIMILGRLEVLAVLGIFSIRYWQSR